MTTRPRRHVPNVDATAEAALVGWLLIHGTRDTMGVRTQVTPDDFHDLDWAACWRSWRPDVEPAVLAVTAGLSDPGRLVDAMAEAPTTATVRSVVQRVLDLAGRRRIARLATDALDRLHHDEPYDVALPWLRSQVAELDLALVTGEPPRTAEQFCEGDDDPYDWVIPDVLERRDRLVVTAGEGAGKSILLTQLAVQTAAGIHPWTGRDIAPSSVLIVDLENGDRRIRRRLRDVMARLPAHRRPGELLRVESRPDGLNVLARGDRSWLLERAASAQPDLVVIGPLYRLHSGVVEGDVGGEEKARATAEALDELRTRFGCALVMETHAPHGDSRTGTRELRPFGSSLWMRWPEFGIGLRVDPDSGGRRWSVKHWRPPRDDRQWPTHVERGGHWPWTAVLPDGTLRPSSRPPARSAEPF